MAKWIKISETKYINEDYITEVQPQGNGTAVLLMAPGLASNLSVSAKDAAELLAHIKASAAQPAGSAQSTPGSRRD